MRKLTAHFQSLALVELDSGAKAKDKIEAGASLVQVYSGFIYRGPELVNEIAEKLKVS